jgi:hypothetical protein
MPKVIFTLAGMPVDFKKSSDQNCNHCKYSYKKMLSKKTGCNVILGLTIDTPSYGYCHMYESKEEE